MNKRYLPKMSHDIIKHRKMWLPLMPPVGDNRFASFTTQSDIPFKPMGLMLWDLPDDAILEMCKIANQESVIAGHGKLPAKVFARAESYEKLKKLVENGEEFFELYKDCYVQKDSWN